MKNAEKVTSVKLFLRHDLFVGACFSKLITEMKILHFIVGATVVCYIMHTHGLNDLIIKFAVEMLETYLKFTPSNCLNSCMNSYYF